MSTAMDFDQSFTGPVDWNFPSPNATPTHHSFGHDIFQTPKTTTTTLPSHFQDAFSTPQMPSYTTPRLQQATTTPQQNTRPEFLSQPQHYVPSQTYLQQAQVQSSSQAQWQQFQSEHVLSSNVAQDTFQVQTPPPTRDSGARKVSHQPVAFGTPSTIATRRYMTPQKQSELYGQEQALHLQFPPVTQPFSNTGPATAPVRSSIPWEAGPVFPRQSATLEDPFMSNIPNDMAWSFQHGSGYDNSALQYQVSQTVSQSMASSAATTSMSATAMSGSVNPSLVYSSPVHMMQPAYPRPRSAMPGSQSERRRVSANTKHARTDTTSSGESQARSGALRRSNTTGSSSNAIGDIFGRIADVPRTASPLKRVGRTPLGSISESSKQRHRSSVILTVDENGLARTETQDDSPTRSMRARYPGLFDSDSSDAESDGSPESADKQASFSFTRQDERKQKVAKLDPPIDGFEGLSIPRSTSSSSLRGTVTPSRAAVAAAVQLRRQGSLRRSGSLRQSQSRNRLTTSIDTCPMNVTEEQSWQATSPEKPQQQFDFTPSSARRTRPPRALMQNTLDAHNRRWSLMSVEQGQADPFVSGSQNTKKMRCVCGTTSEQGQSVVQCTSCTQWSHVTCVGLEKATAPKGFCCLLCTKPM